MSGSDELKKLLDRLKDEVGPLPAPPQPAEADPRPAPRPVRYPARQPSPEWEVPRQRPEQAFRPHRPEAQREKAEASLPASLAWSENKETVLFGMLASLIAVFGGILAGMDYLVLIGGVVFLLFSCVMLLFLFGYYLNSRMRSPESRGLAERVDALSRKVETISAMAASSGSRAYQASTPEKERELEHKVEELRVLVKTLARAVDQQDRNGR